MTVGQLRILAFHGVDDLDHFGAVVRRVLERYQPVRGDEVAQAVAAGRRLRPRSVWFTFDDGLRSTYEAGELLASLGVSATLFVNPATIAGPALHWFTIRDLAAEHGLIGVDEEQRFSMRRLKTIADADRRSAVEELSSRLGALPGLPESLSGSVSDMNRWVELGHEVGNHTWDHPCLDHCTGDQQRSQIEQAHEWLLDHGVRSRFFAYPNGDSTPQTSDVLNRLGYQAAVLFDHRLVRSGSDPYRLSRLRIDASAPLDRVDAILSGAHPLLFGILNRSERR